MIDWLNTPRNPVFENADFPELGGRKPAPLLDLPRNPVSQLENEGAAQQQDETANACEKNAPPLSEPRPHLLDAVAARPAPAAVEELQTQAGGNAERLAQLCRLALAAPPPPTPEDVAELDALMVRLCELEPWLAGYLAEMQAARRRMAPASVAESLAQFRQFVREAEARRGAVGGAGIGKPSAPKKAGE